MEFPLSVLWPGFLSPLSPLICLKRERRKMSNYYEAKVFQYKILSTGHLSHCHPLVENTPMKVEMLQDNRLVLIQQPHPTWPMTMIQTTVEHTTMLPSNWIGLLLSSLFIIMCDAFHLITSSDTLLPRFAQQVDNVLHC